MLRQYFSCNERFEIFLTFFCNNLCYVEYVDEKDFKKLFVPSTFLGVFTLTDIKQCRLTSKIKEKK